MHLTTEIRAMGGRAKALKIRTEYIENPILCQQCSGPILPNPDDSKPMRDIRKKRFCSLSCAAKYNNARHPKRKKKVEQTKEKPDLVTVFGTITKSELFARAKNWQSARNQIRDHAGNVFRGLNMPSGCSRCNYQHHAEVCHLRAVSDFPGTSTLNEINAPENLVALCPNCHWEYDQGIWK
jgi:hypothetical protein